MRFLISISNSMERFATKKVIIIPLFVMLATVLAVMEIISVNAPTLRTNMLDMRYYGYSPSEVFKALNSIGPIGRELYMKFLVIDFVFIIIFMLFLSLILMLLIKKAGLSNRFMLINVLPFLRSALDATENGLIMTLLINYPFQMPSIVALSSTVTVAKFIVLAVIVVVLSALVVLTILKAFR